MGKSKRYYSKRMKRQKLMKQAALERIHELVKMADEIFPKNSILANRYIQLARKLAMATKISFPSEYHHKVCHSCKRWLRIAYNVRYRIGHIKNYASYLTVTCLNCGHTTRYLFKGPACRNLRWINEKDKITQNPTKSINSTNSKNSGN
ncbi:ribonuclease P protein component 4 [Candidatus Harpocratesius sp.]